MVKTQKKQKETEQPRKPADLTVDMTAKRKVRNIIAYILVTALLWTTVVAGNIMGTDNNQEQTQSSTLGGIEEGQKHVMSVKKMCKLLNIKRLTKEEFGWSPTITTIDNIRISMNEICAKEKDFKNKAAPTTEIVIGVKLEIIYCKITIWYEHTNRVIESKHIRALSRFLQMFAGCRIESLDIENEKMTQDKEELQRIRDILQANSWTDTPIFVESLMFSSTTKARATHPILLQLVIEAVGGTGVAEEELRWINISIAANHIQQTIQLLSGLRYKKVTSLSITIKDEEQSPYEEAEKESSLEQSEQEWKYDVENIRILLKCDNCSIVLPVWLVKKPTRELVLDMLFYMCLSKEVVESIRAQKLEVYIGDETDQSSIENDTTRKKSEGVTNETIIELRLNYWEYTPKHVLTKEETLKCARYCLAWAATQFPSLTHIYINRLDYLCSDYLSLFQIIDRISVVFNPKMQSLRVLFLNLRMVKLLTTEYTPFRKMPFVIRPKLWQAFVTGKVEEQINKQKNLKKDQEEYIRMQPSESDKNTEQFGCPICLEEFGKDDESNWIYVTGPCRHAFCLKCLNTDFKNRAPACILDRISLPGDWRACWRIEEAESNEYSMALSSIKGDNDGKVQIGEFEEANLIVKY